MPIASRQVNASRLQLHIDAFRDASFAPTSEVLYWRRWNSQSSSGGSDIRLVVLPTLPLPASKSTVER